MNHDMLKSKILLVDDERDIIGLLEEVLRRLLSANRRNRM